MRPAYSCFRPLLEPLEGRDCPAAPVISLTSAAYGNSMVTLSGVVQDEAPGGLRVCFMGKYSGSTTTDAIGAFSITVTPCGAGTIGARTTDQEGLASNMAFTTVANAIPGILNFLAEHVEGQTWRLTGAVQDESPAGLTVCFGGTSSLCGKTTQVQADGTFCLVVELAEGEEGMVAAWVRDWWNQMSQVVWSYVCDVEA
jgi:hypothetical protein